MNKIALTITGMSCSGCTSSVEKILKMAAPQASVRVSLEPGGAEVEGADLPDVALLCQAIEKAGFKAQSR